MADDHQPARRLLACDSAEPTILLDADGHFADQQGARKPVGDMQFDVVPDRSLVQPAEIARKRGYGHVHDTLQSTPAPRSSVLLRITHSRSHLARRDWDEPILQVNHSPTLPRSCEHRRGAAKHYLCRAPFLAERRTANG